MPHTTHSLLQDMFLAAERERRRRILFAPIATPSLAATVHPGMRASGGFGGYGGGGCENTYHPHRNTWSGGRRRMPSQRT